MSVEGCTRSHHVMRVHSYWDGRRQTDEPCRNTSCPGVGRVTVYHAPDVGWNWVKCCCCGDEWVPGFQP